MIKIVFGSLIKNIGYLEIPKVACTSIKATLLISDNKDINHISNMEIHEHAHWKTFVGMRSFPFIFTFVRNPFDRLVSCYLEKVLTNKIQILMPGCKINKYSSFSDFISFIVEIGHNRADRHFAAQSSFTNGLRLDFIGRFERLVKDWKILQKAFDLPDLSHKNKNPRRRGHYSEYFTSTDIKLAEEYYRKDLENFGYNF